MNKSVSQPSSAGPSSARLRLGTRGSPLARWQADWVANRLRELGVEVELIGRLTEQLTGEFSATWLDAEYKEE